MRSWMGRASSFGSVVRIVHVGVVRSATDLPIEQRYTAAIKLLGIDPMMLASEAGHA